MNECHCGTERSRMKTIQSEIIIKAPVEEVWAVLQAFPLYPEWNPFIRAVKGKTLAEERLTVKAKLNGLPEIAFIVTIRSFVPPVKLGWQAIFLKGIFEAYHYFEIYQISPCRSRFIHREEFRGIFSSPILFLLRRSFSEGYQMMNEALKKRVEADFE